MKLMRKKSLGLPILALLFTAVNSLGKLWGDLKPRSYKDGDKIDVHVSRLWSAVYAPMPYDFYSLNWCQSTAGHEYDGGYNRMFKNHYSHNDEANSNLHESPYVYRVGFQDTYQVVCKKIFNITDQNHFIDMIRERYRYQLFIDGLPNALLMPKESGDGTEVNFREGILVGTHTPEDVLTMTINNHLHFTVKVHHVPGGDEVRIVGFEVEPMSIAKGSPLDLETLRDQPKQYLRKDGVPTDVSEGVVFSYSWTTINDESTTWAHRFDQYYEIGKYDVHVK